MEQFYDSKLSLDTPIDWWHQLQGGQVAELRPPPPGATDPYPNLSRIPPRPTPTDPATRRTLVASLAAQRDRAKQLAEQEPVVWPVPGAPSVPAPPAAAGAKPSRPGAVPPPPASVPGKRAGTTPAAAPGPQQPAAQNENSDPSKLVFEGATAAPVPAKAAASQPVADPNPPAPFTRSPRPSEPPPSGPIPALPVAAPPLARLAGIPASAAVPESIPRPRPAAQFRFSPGSAELPEPAQAALRQLVSRRAGGGVQVTAGGDATSLAPEAQERALPLALRRTGAITAVLIAAGVPSASIRAEAVAPGREGIARLID